MKKLIFFLLVVLAGACRNTDNRFVVNGFLSDKSFDGEMIYLVPLINSSKDRVDSTVIADGQFKFDVAVDSTEICIIRAKPVLRFFLQELLVVKEPGAITVKIGPNSVAKGTAQNDSLQHWKENKILFDSLLYTRRKQYLEADGQSKLLLKHQVDSLARLFTEMNFQTALNNKNNVVGKLVGQMMSPLFSEEQKKKLNNK